MSKVKKAIKKAIPGKKKYPSKPMVLPKELKGVENGKLTPKMLGKTVIGGTMWKGAVPAFNRMCEDAKAAGIEFANIGDYRPFERQLEMFKDRYSAKKTPRVPEVTRTYEGKTWYLKKGKSPSGTPGTSNHGLGLAMDLGVRRDGQITTISSVPKAEKWICENGPKYGFYLQGSDPKSPEFELWHWQYAIGDETPPALAVA